MTGDYRVARLLHANSSWWRVKVELNGLNSSDLVHTMSLSRACSIAAVITIPFFPLFLITACGIHELVLRIDN